MDKVGVIKSIDGDAAIIEITRSGACGSACSTCKLNCETMKMDIRAINNINASAGQLVRLHSEYKMVMKATLIVYIMPLILMIVGIGLGMMGAEYLGYNDIKEPIAVGIGVVCLFLAYLFLSLIDKKIKKDKKMEIIVSEIIR